MKRACAFQDSFSSIMRPRNLVSFLRKISELNKIKMERFEQAFYQKKGYKQFYLH